METAIRQLLNLREEIVESRQDVINNPESDDWGKQVDNNLISKYDEMIAQLDIELASIKG